MPDPSTPMNRMRRVNLALSGGYAPAGDDAEWLVAGLTRYEAGAGTVTLEAALGLTASGPHAWWTVERMQARDAALAQFRHTRLQEMQDTQAAAEIARLAHRNAPSLRPILCYGAIPKAKQVLAILRKSPPTPIIP